MSNALALCLPIMVLFQTLVAPLGSGYWSCEGRTCGVSIWACCCAAPGDHCDPTCRPRTPKKSDSSSDSRIASSGGCNCEMVSAAEPVVQAPHPLWPLFELAAALPVIAPPPVSPVAEADVRLDVTRGPPLTLHLPGSSALRAPPCLCLSN